MYDYLIQNVICLIINYQRSVLYVHTLFMNKMNIIITSSSFSSNILRRCSGIISLSPMMEEKVHNYNYNDYKTKLSDYIPHFLLKNTANASMKFNRKVLLHLQRISPIEYHCTNSSVHWSPAVSFLILFLSCRYFEIY